MTENTAEINKHYDRLIRSLTPEELEYDCALDKGLAEYCTAHQDIKYDKIIEKMTPEELDSLCSNDLHWKKYYLSNKCVVYEKILKKYEVDYTNEHCLIYIDEDIENFYDEEDTRNYDITWIYDLFLKYYDMEEIDCTGKGVTSIPRLPKLKKLNCCDNDITCLPVLENLEELTCLNNRFVEFPGLSNLPKSQGHIDVNLLDNFLKKMSGFPSLKLFNGKDGYEVQLRKHWYRRRLL